MQNEKKSLVEEALLQMKNLEEAVTQNAKGILASTMKEEISELVKESLEEVEKAESMKEVSEMEEGEHAHEMEEQAELEMDDEESDDEESDDEFSDETLGGEEDLMALDLPGDELEVDDEEEVLLPLDLRTASDDEILKVFKAMGEEDGIIVSKDEDSIHLKDTNSDVEYEIHTEGEDEEETIDEMYEEDDVVYEIEISEDEDETEDYEDESSDEEYEEMSEGNYGMGKGEKSKTHKGDEDYTTKKGMTKKTKAFGGEVEESMTIKPKGMGMNLKKKSFDLSEMEDSEMEDGEMKEGSMTIKPKGVGMNLKKKSFEMSEEEEAETTEAARTLGNGSKNDPKRHGLPKQKVRTVSESELAKEVESLRAKNEEYRKALNIFREKLNEVAVFNSNLAYATRLFTEHTTTKQEKINILRRFDTVESLKESKTLYKTLKEEYQSKETSTISESVEAKVAKTPSRGASTNLIESKTYENPQFLRMKDLMSKLQK